MAKQKKRHGCLIIFIILLLVVASLGFGIWNFLFNPKPNAEAMKIIEGPIDTIASRQLTEMLTESIGPGVSAVVVPMPDAPEKSGTIIVIDTGNGFTPAAGQAGKRKQAMDAINTLIEQNQNQHLNLSVASVTYRENGQNIISLANSMESLESLANGTISEGDFAAKMGLKVNNYSYFKDLIDNW